MLEGKAFVEGERLLLEAWELLVERLLLEDEPFFDPKP